MKGQTALLKNCQKIYNTLFELNYKVIYDVCVIDELYTKKLLKLF